MDIILWILNINKTFNINVINLEKNCFIYLKKNGDIVNFTLITYLQIVASQQAYKINLSIFIPISLLPFTAKLFQFFYTHWGTLLHFLSWHHFNQDFTNTSLQNILLSTIKQQPLGHQIQCSTLSLHITFFPLLHFFLALRTHFHTPLTMSLGCAFSSLC